MDSKHPSFRQDSGQDLDSLGLPSTSESLQVSSFTIYKGLDVGKALFALTVLFSLYKQGDGDRMFDLE